MILPTWFILAAITGFSSNLYNFINRFFLRHNEDPTAYAWYTESIRFIIFSTIAFSDWHIVLTTKSIILFGLVGLTEFFGGYLYMKMHANSELSISSILSRTRIIWIPVLAFLTIGEQLSTVSYFGIIIMFIGISLAVSPKKLFIDHGARYALFSAFIVAINVILIKALIPFGSPVTINAIMSIPSIFLYPLLMKNSISRIRKIPQKYFGLKTFAAGLSVFQLYIFTVALKFGDASKINAVYQSMMIFSVLAGIIFLKERTGIGKKVIGATIVITGVLLVTVF